MIENINISKTQTLAMNVSHKMDLATCFVSLSNINAI